MQTSPELTDHQVHQLQDVARITARVSWRKPWVHYTGLDEEDLAQIASIGALKAHRSFRPGGTTYRGWLIIHARGELRHALRSPVARMIRIPRVEYEGRRPRPFDYHVQSLDSDLSDNSYSGDKGGLSGAEVIADPQVDSSEWPMLRDLLARLIGDESRAVFLYNVCGFTQTEISQCLGVSQTHVSRSVRQGTAQLRMMTGWRQLQPERTRRYTSLRALPAEVA